MKIFKENVDKQIESNQGKNLFNSAVKNSLSFIPETIRAIARIGELDPDSENLLIDYATSQALREFCRINQYYNFNTQNQNDLRDIYVELFWNIKKHKTSNESISKKHYSNLINWLAKTNEFAEKMYSAAEDNLEPVACYEYGSEIQLEILQIDLRLLQEPILDIGCGEGGNLVKFLRKDGFQAFGFDRFVEDNPYLTQSDWFEFDYGIKKWGTIISNLGFSNHFQHHHQRNDGLFIDFAKKYMDILNSLEMGGSFHYAPELPFIEQYLDQNKYKISKFTFGKFDFKSVKVVRVG